MKLLEAQAFVAVVELGGLRPAAERLGVSAATVSRRLAELEESLGVRLLERTTRSLRVTDAGRVFHSACARGLESMQAAEELVAARAGRVAGTVRVSTARNLGPLLLEGLAAVQRAHPELRLVLVETELLLDAHRDSIDLFLRVGEPKDDRLVARLLGSYPHVLVASREYLRRAGRPQQPKDLESHRLLLFDNRRGLLGVDLLPTSGGPPERVELRPSFAANDYETLARAARAGMGIAELPAILLGLHAGLGRVLPGYTLGEAKLHLLYASDRLLSRAVRAVVEGLARTLPPHLRELRSAWDLDPLA